MYVCVKNIVIFYVDFTKKYLLSLFSPPTHFNSQIHKPPTCKMNVGEHGGNSKIRSFEKTCFSNEPKVFLLQLRFIF